MIALIRKVLRKIGHIYWLVRYGPTELADLRARLDSHENLRPEFDAFRTALSGDLQFVRQSLAADMRREVAWLRDRAVALEAAFDRLDVTAPPAVLRGALPTAQHRAQEAFYPALEEHFRGTRPQILQRLTVYRPWIDAAPPGQVADLGCGRGEWLELLTDWGRPSVGVDTNAVLVAHNRSLGFNVVQEDAVAWLGEQPAGSLAAISSFHVLEHLPFGLLLVLVDRACRALAPGGLLILETPNPENLLVATHTFWIDPTHVRPLPPALLEFVVTRAGLVVEATPRLNPPEQIVGDVADPGLQQLLMQGRDYAVIGRKPIT
jgi:SAM-dependent methyltransferase